MSPEKKITTLAWHCGQDAKEAFQSLAALDGLTASELLDKLASDYINNKVREARLVLDVVERNGSVGTEGTGK